MKHEYDWRLSLENDFNFKGGLVPCLSTMYKERHAKYGTVVIYVCILLCAVFCILYSQFDFR